MKAINSVLGILFLILFTGCSSSEESIQTKSIDGKWNKKTEQKFDFEISDAQNPKNIIFVIRNNNEYPYSNIRLIVNFTDLKNKKSIKDTMNYILAQPNGEWIGSGFGDTKETLFQYKLNYKFKENGKYQIGLIQAMRNDNLPGIEDIGLKIETAKP